MIELLSMKKTNGLSEMIKRARVLAGFSQKDLARKLGLSDKTISAYETGRAIPPLPTLEKIADVTRRPVEEFLNGSVESNGEIKKMNRKLDLIMKELSGISKKLQSYEQN